MRLRKAAPHDVPVLLELINGYADRGLLLPRTEESLRDYLDDFSVVLGEDDRIVACGALTELGPGLGEIRSLAVKAGQEGRGVGGAIVEALMREAHAREFEEVLALTRRVAFFTAHGFTVARRERFLDKLAADCQTCPMNLCCDETAMVRVPELAETADVGSPHAVAEA